MVSGHTVLMPISTLQVLLTWCNQNGIYIDPRIQVRECGNHHQLADSTESSYSSSSRGPAISVYSLETLIDRSCSRESLLYISCSQTTGWLQEMISVFGTPSSGGVDRNEHMTLKQTNTLSDLLSSCTHSEACYFINQVLLPLPGHPLCAVWPCCASRTGSRPVW